MKKFTRHLRLLVCLLTPLFCTQALAETPPPQITGGASIAPMLTKVLPAVVNITVQGSGIVPILPPQRGSDNSNNNDDDNDDNGDNSGNFANRKFTELGSGIIINAKEGLIITNAHVIKDGNLIVVSLRDGRHIRAEVVGSDKPSDIALIKIKSPHLTEIPLADSDKLQVGDFVAAIGNPFGLDETVTSGVISALNRSDIGIEGYENFIQTDAPINPGNSGGALINFQGELIGMNTALVAPPQGGGGNVGIGFAIPTNMIQSVVAQLIEYGQVRRGVLGVMVQNIDPNLSDALKLDSKLNGDNGALVTDVAPNSPAEKAGLLPLDVILKFNGKPINNKSELRNAVGLLAVGKKAELGVLRQNKNISLTATIVSPEDVEKAAHKYPLIAGLQLRPYQEFDNQSRYVAGLQVLFVGDGSPGWLAGIRPGDIIQEINQNAVLTLESLEQVLKPKPKSLLLKIRRQTATIFTVIPGE